jgi:hypothetical protein
MDWVRWLKLCNPGYLGGRDWQHHSSRLAKGKKVKFVRPHLNQCQYGCTCLVATWVSTDKRIKVWTGLVIKGDPISEITNAKRAGSMAHWAAQFKKQNACLTRLTGQVQAPEPQKKKRRKKKKSCRSNILLI